VGLAFHPQEFGWGVGLAGFRPSELPSRFEIPRRLHGTDLNASQNSDVWSAGFAVAVRARQFQVKHNPGFPAFLGLL